MRPQLSTEEGDALKVDLQGDHDMIVKSAVQKSITGARDISSSWEFNFDRIFAPDVTQAAIFEEIALLVQSALDGYRVAIFAYGQTGGGKTYTMEGPQGAKGDTHSAGIIPRTVDLIFAEMKEMHTRGWTFQAHISMIEVYNENVYDLLAAKSGSVTPREGAKIEAAADSFRQVRVESAGAVHHFFNKASRDRHVAATACNDRSSRSHMVFQLTLSGSCKSGDQIREVQGILSLVDLAGSERVEKSQATGDRLKEAQHINRSLSALGDVVEALAKRGANGSKHVPYRNSKLTMLLKESLGGDAKALMFVNVSMCHEHLGETISSLRFASKVHACNVGVAKRVAGP
jgi:kinesin family protein C1